MLASHGPDVCSSLRPEDCCFAASVDAGRRLSALLLACWLLSLSYTLLPCSVTTLAGALVLLALLSAALLLVLVRDVVLLAGAGAGAGGGAGAFFSIQAAVNCVSAFLL